MQNTTHKSSQNDSRSSRNDRLYKKLRLLALFEEVSNEDLQGVVKESKVRPVSLDRDQFISPELVSGMSERPGLILVMRGQVGVGVFDRKKLKERLVRQERLKSLSKEELQNESALKPPPLARVAKKNIAKLQRNELFNLQTLNRVDLDNVQFYTLAPSVLVFVEHDVFANWVSKYPKFEAKLRKATEVSRERLRSVDGVKQEVLDFFVRHGISVSGEMVRVRQLGTCIDCKLCEIACEDRYGAKRLTLGGYQLGMLDFVFTCRSCTDQRCIDPCDYDSIRFDKASKEIIINESSCVGCTLCSEACPYNAIEMVDVDDPANPTHRKKFKKRLEKNGHLQFGPGKPRVAKVRRIANKCDHCNDYSDQACVSACPTGSLIELNAKELFVERTDSEVAYIDSGYDPKNKIKDEERLPVYPFTEGLGVRNSGIAKTRRRRLFPLLLWGAFVSLWLVAFSEILLRLYRPASSLQYWMFRGQGMDEAIAKLKVGFRAGSDLAIDCGWLGTGLMVFAMLYTPMRRISLFRKIAANTMWFDLHLLTGTMGPAFVILHSGVNYNTYAAGAFWSMMIVFLSGVMGRYLYTQIPNMLNGRELEELDHKRALANIKKAHSNAVDVAEALLAKRRDEVDRIAKTNNMWKAFLWLVKDDMRRPGRWLMRSRLIKATRIPGGLARELSSRTGRLILVERRRVFASQAHLILLSWKKIHVPFSIIMTLLTLHHVWLEFPKTL